MIAPLAANVLWYTACLRQQRAFRRATRNVEATQHALLLALIRRNAHSAFGRAHGFATIRSIEEYQRRVPLSDYDDYRDAIVRIGAGEQGVLAAEPVLLFEPTSGSTAATKQIPYTAALRAEFQRGIAPWIADLFGGDPRLMAGTAYWSVTPVARRDEYTP